MNPRIIEIDDVKFDISKLRSVFSADGLPRWSGKIEIEFVDIFDGPSSIVTANWSGKEESREGTLCDFEGEDAILCDGCEMHAADWSVEISKHLARPSAWDAHHNDLRDRGIIAA